MPGKLKKSKKKGAKKKGKKAAKLPTDEPLTAAQENLLLKAQIQSLKQQVQALHELQQRSEAVVRKYRARMIELDELVLEERARAVDVTADLNRQIDIVRETMRDQLDSSRDELTSLHNEMQSKCAAKDEIITDQQRMIQQRDAQIREWRIKFADATREFETMLQATLAKMSERIEVDVVDPEVAELTGRASARYSLISAAKAREEGLNSSLDVSQKRLKPPSLCYLCVCATATQIEKCASLARVITHGANVGAGHFYGKRRHQRITVCGNRRRYFQFCNN
ncbi:MAG: hypothetical protein MHM6MM_002724 [Cercozoa sp. M6MM]